jgi:ABC-type proline/glycine betaine transport system substrate-binding protein
MVKSISETVTDTLMEVNPDKYMQEQLGQAQTAAGGVEGAKEKYGVKGYKAGGKITEKVKKTAKKIEEASKQSEPKPPKGDIKNIPSGYMDFGAQLDPTDKKVFLYGVKKIGDDTFLQGAAKGEKDFKANIQKGNMDVGVSRQGNDKQINFTYKRTFKHGGLVCRGQGKARKKNFKVY